MQERIVILGVPIDNITKQEAGQITLDLVKQSNKSCKMIFAPNVEFIMKAQKDKEFFDILKTGNNKGIQNVFEDYTDYLAIAVNNLRMCFDCDVILGGNVGAYMADYIDDFRKKAIQLNPFEKDGSYIRVCHYRTEAAAVGAAIYYIEQFIQNF